MTVSTTLRTFFLPCVIKVAGWRRLISTRTGLRPLFPKPPTFLVRSRDLSSPKFSCSRDPHDRSAELGIIPREAIFERDLLSMVFKTGDVLQDNDPKPFSVLA